MDSQNNCLKINTLKKIVSKDKMFNRYFFNNQKTVLRTSQSEQRVQHEYSTSNELHKNVVNRNIYF